MKQKKWLISSYIFMVLNLLDAGFTDFGLRHGFVTEANPLMDWLYQCHIGLFYLIKIMFPILLIYLFHSHFHIFEKNKWIRLMYIFCFVSYVLVSIWHFVWMGAVLILIH